jgi:hypothetical protein
MIITLFFLEKRQFFRRKLSKIAENCDPNIDPWSPWARPTSRYTYDRINQKLDLNGVPLL